LLYELIKKWKKLSKVQKWQYEEFYLTNRYKLIKLLLSEIIFLDNCYKKASCENEKQLLKSAVDKLDYLLMRQEQNYDDLSDGDFKMILMIIYGILNNIIENLNV